MDASGASSYSLVHAQVGSYGLCGKLCPPTPHTHNAHSMKHAGNGITERGAVALSNALCSNSTLQTLNLGYNRLGDEGMLALAYAVGANRTLVKLLLGREWGCAWWGGG